MCAACYIRFKGKQAHTDVAARLVNIKTLIISLSNICTPNRTERFGVITYLGKPLEFRHSQDVTTITVSLLDHVTKHRAFRSITLKSSTNRMRFVFSVHGFSFILRVNSRVLGLVPDIPVRGIIPSSRQKQTLQGAEPIYTFRSIHNMPDLPAVGTIFLERKSKPETIHIRAVS